MIALVVVEQMKETESPGQAMDTELFRITAHTHARTHAHTHNHFNHFSSIHAHTHTHTHTQQILKSYLLIHYDLKYYCVNPKLLI